MNFQDYRAFKDSLDLDKFLRLDCMNPMKAMEFLMVDAHDVRAPISADTFLEQVRQHLGETTGLSASLGVRAALTSIFHAYQDRVIHIPQEVYPVYFEIAAEQQHQGYSIFEPHALDRITDSVILSTLNHFGSLAFNPDLAEAILANNNILIIDAVYDYSHAVRAYLPLLASNKLFIACSLSKSQLDYKLGYVCHQSDIPFEAAPAYPSLDRHLPQQQLRAIDLRWQQINDLSAFKFEACAHPYFRVIKRSFHDLLDDDILGIPLSVFSNNPADNHTTVVSCLFEIDKHVDTQLKAILG